MCALVTIYLGGKYEVKRKAREDGEKEKGYQCIPEETNQQLRRDRRIPRNVYIPPNQTQAIFRQRTQAGDAGDDLSGSIPRMVRPRRVETGVWLIGSPQATPVIVLWPSSGVARRMASQDIVPLYQCEGTNPAEPAPGIRQWEICVGCAADKIGSG